MGSIIKLRKDSVVSPLKYADTTSTFYINFSLHIKGIIEAEYDAIRKNTSISLYVPVTDFCQSRKPYEKLRCAQRGPYFKTKLYTNRNAEINVRFLFYDKFKTSSAH